MCVTYVLYIFFPKLSRKKKTIARLKPTQTYDGIFESLDISRAIKGIVRERAKIVVTPLNVLLKLLVTCSSVILRVYRNSYCLQIFKEYTSLINLRM